MHWSSLTPPAATTTTTATVAHCVILLNNYRQAQFNLQRNCQQINMQESSQSESCSTQYEQKQFSYSIVYLPKTPSLFLSLLLDLHLFVLFVASVAPATLHPSFSHGSHCVCCSIVCFEPASKFVFYWHFPNGIIIRNAAYDAECNADTHSYKLYSLPADGKRHKTNDCNDSLQSRRNRLN